MATFADTNAFTITVASASAPVTVSGAVTAQAATTSGTVTAFAVVDASGEALFLDELVLGRLEFLFGGGTIKGLEVQSCQFEASVQIIGVFAHRILVLDDSGGNIVTGGVFLTLLEIFRRFRSRSRRSGPTTTDCSSSAALTFR